MLGLPVLTAPGGFYPTTLLFFLCWAFMVVTGLLLLEVNLWFSDDVSIVTMAGKTLGRWAGGLSWLLFAFLFYSLMIAYSSGSGQLFVDFLSLSTGIVLPLWAGSLFFCVTFGIFLYRGTGSVDQINRLLMIGPFAAYFVLIVMGSRHVHREYLEHVNWPSAFWAIPAMIVSFGFHNLVPSLTTYLNRDGKKLRIAILVGSAIPLLIYLVWQWLILGMVPLAGEGGFLEALEQGDMATRALKHAVGSSWIVSFAEYFAFFAIVTSFLSVALSFVDFLADGLQVKKDAKGKAFLCLLSLAPPFVFSTFYPHVFLSALSYAGGFGAVVLFGIFPALMVWVGRQFPGRERFARFVPGGEIALMGVILFSCAVFILELMHQV